MLIKIKSWLDSQFRYTSTPPLSLLSHYEDSTITFIVVKDKLGNIFKEKLSKVARSPVLIRQFSAQDAHLLGYLLGHEDTLATIKSEKILAN